MLAAIPPAPKPLRRFPAGVLRLSTLVLAAGCVRAHFLGPLPRIEGTEPVSGISADVVIERDGLGIPTVTGSGWHDLAFAQGYTQAQDRLFQMEMSRRIASGRLAEVAGPEALPVDRLVRILGLRRVAAREFELLDPGTRDLLAAYAAGVNAFVRSLDGAFPLGFKLLDFQPEPWRPTDSLVIAKLLALQLSFNWQSELVRKALLDRFARTLGESRIRELFPDDRSDHPGILPETHSAAVSPPPSPAPPREAAVDGAELPAADLLAALDEVKGALGSVMLAGSNSWVVDGTRTASGKPLLANDPHLMPQMPSIWYENRLADRSSGRWVSGVSLAGIPGVVIGRNDRIAWGFTTSFADVQDLFLEMLDDAAAPLRYLDGERLRDLEFVDERIEVRGSDEVIERVYLTSRGPLLSRWLPREASPVKPRRDFSIAWTGLVPGPTAEAILKLDTAGNWGDFLEAFRRWTTPSQNAVYADVDGNIGYLLTGKIPVRKRGDGTLPAPGWTGEYAWTGTIPFDEMPRLWNPPSHAIVTANNRVAPAGFPYLLGQEAATAYRAARIAEMLGAGGRFSAEDFARMQGDVASLAAPEIVPRILEVEPSSELEAKALAELGRWDGRAGAESAGAALYEVFSWRLPWITLGDELRDLAPYVIGQGLTPFDPANPFYRHTARLVRRKVTTEPEWAWFDDSRTSEVETAPDIVKRAFSEAVAYLRQELGSDTAEWKWGKIHAILFQNLLGRSAVAETIFHLSRGPFPIGGDSDTVLQSAFAPAKPYGAMAWVPSYRMVVDMADPATALVRNTTGQSEHPASPHYDDMIQDWLAVVPRRDEMKPGGGSGAGGTGAAGTPVLRLVPAKQGPGP